MPGITTDRIDERTAVVHPGIEIDVQHAAAIRDVLIELHSDGVTQYVIDLTDVEFIDSTGLSVLYRAWRRAAHNGGRLSIAAPNDRIRKALRAINFPAQIHETVEISLQRTMAAVN